MNGANPKYALSDLKNYTKVLRMAQRDILDLKKELDEVRNDNQEMKRNESEALSVVMDLKESN
eukprot:3422331-Ditylum_brightwellii.AAC.1